jgi:hypothetical protein
MEISLFDTTIVRLRTQRQYEHFLEIADDSGWKIFEKPARAPFGDQTCAVIGAPIDFIPLESVDRECMRVISYRALLQYNAKGNHAVKEDYKEQKRPKYSKLLYGMGSIIAVLFAYWSFKDVTQGMNEANMPMFLGGLLFGFAWLVIGIKWCNSYLALIVGILTAWIIDVIITL